MVRAGEAGGFLDVVLSQISDFRTREQDLKGKVKAAMVYPIVLGILAVGVLIFMLTFFIPRFTPIFAQFGSDLPVLTKMIIAMSNVVKNYGLFVVGGVVGGGHPDQAGNGHRHRPAPAGSGDALDARARPDHQLTSRWFASRECWERW